jgi:hypothetical protein
MSMVAKALALGLTLAVLLPGWADAADEARLALLIGNSTYIHAGTLASPGNDVALVSQTLKALGFAVAVKTDLTAAATQAALRRFRTAAAKAEAAVIYYVGRGFLRGGKSYVPAIDAASSRRPILRRWTRWTRSPTPWSAPRRCASSSPISARTIR